jgi:hypothetical protein
MSPFISPNQFYRRISTGPTTDVEMLQTDVMRFFAILCLCLMAIFALVKALPMSSADDNSPVAAASNLETAAADLHQKIAALKVKLVETRSALRAATAGVAKSTAQAARVAAMEARTQSNLSRTQKELTMVTQSLQGVRNEIAKREAALAQMVKEIDTKRRMRSSLQAQIDTETKDLKKIQATLAQYTRQLKQAQQQKKHNPVETSKQSSSAPSIKKGFTLRFVSDTALDAQVSQGKVQFFALANHKAWQLKLVKERPMYIAVQPPTQIYEMETTTVPVAYADVFSRQVAASARSKVTWGVTLPQEMAAAINRLIQNREGGDLIIMSDGEVVLN